MITGAAAGVIMPTIITDHIATANSTSRVAHDMSITIPMSAIIRSCSIIGAISRSRRNKYAHATAVNTTIDAEMIRRSRGERTATGEASEPSRLRALPGKRSVLPVVPAGRVAPRQPQRFDAALRGARQRKRIGGRVTGMFETQLGVGIETTGAGGRHVDQLSRLDRPCAALAVECDWR